MSAKHGSLKAAKSCSIGKLSLIGNHCKERLEYERDDQRQHFIRSFCFELRDQILEEGGPNE